PSSRCSADSAVDLHRGTDDKPPALHRRAFVGRRGVYRHWGRLHGNQFALRPQCSLGSKEISHFLPHSPFARLYFDNHRMGMVHLLWPTLARLAFVWIRGSIHLGAVCVSGDFSPFVLMVGIIAAGARFSLL